MKNQTILFEVFFSIYGIIDICLRRVWDRSRLCTRTLKLRVNERLHLIGSQVINLNSDLALYEKEGVGYTTL